MFGKLKVLTLTVFYGNPVGNNVLKKYIRYDLILMLPRRKLPPHIYGKLNNN